VVEGASSHQHQALLSIRTIILDTMALVVRQLVYLFLLRGVDAWHVFGWGVKDRYCGIQFVYDDELEQSLAPKTFRPTDYFKDIVHHTNEIYAAQYFGDYKLQFYVESVTSLGTRFCNNTERPKLCASGSDGDDNLKDVQVNGARHVLSSELIGYPCLFVFVTPRKIVGVDGFHRYSYAEWTDRTAWGVCDYRLHVPAATMHWRGNTVILSSAYSGNFEDMALLFAREICHSIGCLVGFRGSFGNPVPTFDWVVTLFVVKMTTFRMIILPAAQRGT